MYNRLERANKKTDCIAEMTALLAEHDSATVMFPLMLAATRQVLTIDAAHLIVIDGGDHVITAWSPAPRKPDAEQKARDHLAGAFAGAIEMGAIQLAVERHGPFLVLPVAVSGRRLFAALQVEAPPIAFDEVFLLKAATRLLAVALDREQAWGLAAERLNQVQALEHGLRKHLVDVREILIRGAKRGGEHVARRGQTLTIDIPAAPIFVEADPPRLEEVFDSLIEKTSTRARPAARILLDGRVAPPDQDIGPLPGGCAGPQLVVTLSGDPADAAVQESAAALKLAHRVVDLHGGVLRTVVNAVGPVLEVRLPVRDWKSETRET